MSKKHRKRGAQIGNHNGLKHGFYSTQPPTPQPQDSLPPDGSADELERAITITRKTIRLLLEEHPGAPKLVSYNVSLLHRLIPTRDQLSKPRNENWRKATDRLGRQLSVKPDPNQTQEAPC